MNTQLSPHYRVIEKLGEGGMGEVYLAEDTKLCRKVAIKFLLADDAAEDNSRKRLVREAQATAALDHPNICTIHEIGEDAGRSFIVMQYVEGETLASRLKQQCLSLDEALDIAAQVADAMEEAHAHGIIHRDLKPQNIMLTARGQVKVLDFGLAKMVQSGHVLAGEAGSTVSLLTTPGVPIGTVPFMSPEQLRVEAMDGRSDIFSLGAILFEMVTGSPPFARDNPLATMSAILTSDPPPLSQFKPDVPAQLESVVRKCLEKDCAKRYESARALANDLKALRRGETVSAAVSATAATSGAGRRRRLAWRAGALLTLAGVLALVLLLPPGKNWLRRSLTAGRPTSDGQGTLAQAAQSAPINNIAAMPFVTAGNAEEEFLSRGFTQSLINSLARLPNMRVSAYSAVVRYEKQAFDAAAVGRDLNVEALVTGSFTIRGESLQISVELIDAHTKAYLWGRSYTRQLAGILDMQREVCQDINERLRAGLTSEQRRLVADQHTDNREAYRLYLMGRNAWGRRTLADVKQSIEFFNDALKHDPTYALAYIGLSDAYTTLGVTLPVLPPNDVMPQARAAAERALQYDDSLADAHTSLAVVHMMYDWDWDGAEREFKRAIDLNPNSPSAHNWYAYYLIAMARFDEAEAEGEQARQLDPLSLFFNANKARAFFYARQYDRVLEHCQKILGVNPKFPNAHFMLGLAYMKKGEYERAATAFQTVQTLAGDNPLWNAMLGYTYAKAGRRAAAEKLLDGLQEQARSSYVPPVYLAIIYAGLGDRQQSFTWLEKAVDERAGVMVYLRIEPVFEELNTDARFARLLQRIGLAPLR